MNVCSYSIKPITIPNPPTFVRCTGCDGTSIYMAPSPAGNDRYETVCDWCKGKKIERSNGVGVGYCSTCERDNCNVCKIYLKELNLLNDRYLNCVYGNVVRSIND